MIAEHENPDHDEIPDDLDERLTQIRQRGSEVMPSQQTAGVYNLSAPILGSDGHALASLTCPYITPLPRSKTPDIAEAIVRIVETAEVLSRTIGGLAVPEGGEAKKISI